MVSSTTASLRATATRAFFVPLRRATRIPQFLMVDHPITRPSSVVAASYNTVRTPASPALVTWPTMSVRLDWYRLGVRPSHGPTSRVRLKRVGSSTALLKVRATTAPTPGAVMSIRTTGSVLASSSNRRSILRSSSRKASRTRSKASITSSRAALPAASSRARAAHFTRDTCPILSPKFRRLARIEFSMPVNLSTKNRRPLRTARVSWAEGALTCTALNQPSRTSCAIPRASLRSVFTRIAAKAACTWRASMTVTRNPSRARPA
jgi:hypothetical protein